MTPRSRDEVGRFFDGLEFVEPGLTLVEEWRPSVTAVEPTASGPAEDAVPAYVGVARKP